MPDTPIVEYFDPDGKPFKSEVLPSARAQAFRDAVVARLQERRRPLAAAVVAMTAGVVLANAAATSEPAPINTETGNYTNAPASDD